MSAATPRATMRRSYLILAAMLVAVAATAFLTPRTRLADVLGVPQLEKDIPTAFEDWTTDASGNIFVVNPQQRELLDRIYNQLLNRVYVRPDGHRVMVAVAYGEDQRDGMQLHYPEICYPSQGFRIDAKSVGSLGLGPGRSLPVKRLATSLGDERKESVTYWMVIGRKPIVGGIEKKIAEIRYGLSGAVPDGMLFRLSTIESDPAEGYRLHEQFAQALARSLHGATAERYFGSAGPIQQDVAAAH